MDRNKINEDRLVDFFAHLSFDLTSHANYESSPAMKRQVRRAKKRAAFVRHDLKEQAIAKWRHNLVLCSKPLSIDPLYKEYARTFIERVLWNYTSSVNPILIQKSLDPDHLFDLWGFGPGASVGVRGTHAAQKIDQPMVCTSRCEPYVKRLRGSNPYFAAADAAGGKGTPIVLGSKMTTVPKNEDSVRTIEIQPSGNMVMQLAAGRYVEGALKSIGLDIRNQQPLNKALAKQGSIDGAICTIDLISASDLQSCDLIRHLWPEDWVTLLFDLRTQYVAVPLSDSELSLRLSSDPLYGSSDYDCEVIDGVVHEWVEQKMLSGMGNGFTFPVMTLTLLALVMANRYARVSVRKTYVDWRVTAVFGDDIIVPSHEYDGLTNLLESANLMINHKKSFSKGWFRESCGGDYLNGVDITPVYIRSLATDNEIYTEINKLQGWMARHNIYHLSALRYLYTLLRKGPYLVPFWFGDALGVRTTKVGRRFRHLRYIVERKPYKGQYLMMLAVGGYVEDVGCGPLYTPRPRRVRTCTAVSTLPKGYVDGVEMASVISLNLQYRIDLIVDLVLNGLESVK